MADVIPELKDLLSHHLLGTPYDPTSTQRERFVIDHLAHETRLWETGGNTDEELKAIFGQHDLGQFDLEQWIESKVASGDYLPAEATT
ncbi:hypothetical protein Q9295_10205 [Xinfangfangia sp. CPCC 101601]|uniref:Uncharacterized protein n=1 Tax=Pseudogemmobacter lacusdianii TaxID=3069608 RepID=A0ABU0W0X0_9RHOB|nr:hypothetical protein [Xinfangfangia sp. CPCC 101601]MDQ2066750.1 hypothetical protein [Xinfangfangia sp. CPCC 101601]